MRGDGMRGCPNCSLENAPDVDFCARCREYLRWEPTQLGMPAVTAEASRAPAQSPEGEGASGGGATTGFATRRYPAVVADADPAASAPATPAPDRALLVL